MLETKVNYYLRSVWPEYDQQMHISLEQDRIRVEFYDPKTTDPSYYGIKERSQGVQTFVSFLLTIGAEANQGVIKDTILLLDEPETHLHPSGVRFMLAELIKIAESGNLVFYATHSIFMIDKKNLKRHVILKKERERTSITLAEEDRIGHFMQEEVLYRALGFDPNDEFSSASPYNFVFEGSGDAVLFRDYFEKQPSLFTAINNLSERSAFNSGGGASNIREYFGTKPLPMNTKWVFILDSDSPGEEIAKFLKGKFKENIDREIFIFHYVIDGKGEVELEDLLAANVVIETLESTANGYGIEIPEKARKDFESSTIRFAEFFKQLPFREGVESQDVKGDFKSDLNTRLLPARPRCQTLPG